MKTLAYAFALSTLALAGCGGGTSTSAPPATTADAGETAADTGAVATDDAAVTPATDAGPSAGETYPAGPYGSRVGALFRPFSLNACNRTGDEATWNFDQPDFYSSQLTVVSIAAGWCVPCQHESAMLQAQVIDAYASQGVRFVQLLVQNPDSTAVTPAFCNTWTNRYGLSTPELMDPAFITQPFVPMTAFPSNIIVDRCGRIRWREYGTDNGLQSIRDAIEDTLAHPSYPNCPTDS